MIHPRSAGKAETIRCRLPGPHPIPYRHFYDGLDLRGQAKKAPLSAPSIANILSLTRQQGPDSRALQAKASWGYDVSDTRRMWV